MCALADRFPRLITSYQSSSSDDNLAQVSLKICNKSEKTSHINNIIDSNLISVTVLLHLSYFAGECIDSESKTNAGCFVIHDTHFYTIVFAVKQDQNK